VVKLNVDDNPITSARFGVRSIPAVKLWVDGAMVAEFVGALPEPQIRAFLDQHLPSEASKAATRAVECWRAGDREGAEREAKAALALAPKDVLPAAHLVLAEVALANHDLDSAEGHLARIPGSAAEWNRAQDVRAAIELGRVALAAGSRDEVIKGGGDGDLNQRFAAAVYHMLDGQHREALEALLALVADDRHWNDEAARRAMLVIFDLIGTRSDVSDEYRRRLSLVL
jgi:putative thioredoxin